LPSELVDECFTLFAALAGNHYWLLLSRLTELIIKISEKHTHLVIHFLMAFYRCFSQLSQLLLQTAGLLAHRFDLAPKGLLEKKL
jgi:hypothetical protein